MYIRKLWDNIKYFKTNIVVMTGEEKDNGVKEIFEEIATRTRIFPN